MKLRSKIIVFAVSAVLAWGVGAGLIALYNSNAAMMDINSTLGTSKTRAPSSVAGKRQPVTSKEAKPQPTTVSSKLSEITPMSSYQIAWKDMDNIEVIVSSGGCKVEANWVVATAEEATKIARTINATEECVTDNGRSTKIGHAYTIGKQVVLNLTFTDKGAEPTMLYFR